VMDLCSRRIVVGWRDGGAHAGGAGERSIGDGAGAGRRPGPGLLHHSDRGVQYTCGDYRQKLAARGITCSR
jgi:transposase InsO family protein